MLLAGRGDSSEQGGLERLKMPRISLWTIAFGIGTAFQIWRGATSDAVIFGIATIFLIINSNAVRQESTRRFSLESHLREKVVAIPLLSLIGITLYLSPLHSGIPTWLFIGIAPLALTLTWFSDRPDAIKPGAPIFLSAKVWSGLGILTSLWEVLNYILAERSHDDITHPTITDLVDPVLKNHVGKILFIVIWVAAGITFLKPARPE